MDEGAGRFGPDLEANAGGACGVEPFLAQEIVSLKKRWGRRVVVIPLMEPHIAGRPRRYAALAPSLEALKTFGNKGRFGDYVRKQELGYLCPVNYPAIEAASFPCIIKRTDLNGGKGVELSTSPGHARCTQKTRQTSRPAFP